MIQRRRDQIYFIDATKTVIYLSNTMNGFLAPELAERNWKHWAGQGKHGSDCECIPEFLCGI